MLKLDAYGVAKLQFNTSLGFVCTVITLAITVAYAAVEVQVLIPRLKEQTESVTKISILAGGTVQTDYNSYGSWVAQTISWTDPKTWFIVDEQRLFPCNDKAPGFFCFVNSKTIYGSPTDYSGSNLFISFIPCRKPQEGCKEIQQITAWISSLSIQRSETQLVYLPDVITPQEKTTVKKYQLSVETINVLQDTISQPNVLFNIRETFKITSYSEETTVTSGMTPAILSNCLISFRYALDTTRQPLMVYRPASATVGNCLARVGGFAVSIYLIVRGLLALVMAVLFNNMASGVFIAPANQSSERKTMWRRFSRELDVLVFLKQQMALRQFLEKKAKKESFRSTILEASDASSSEDKKPVHTLRQQNHKIQTAFVEDQSAIVLENLDSPQKKFVKLPPIYEKEEIPHSAQEQISLKAKMIVSDLENNGNINVNPSQLLKMIQKAKRQLVI